MTEEEKEHTKKTGIYVDLQMLAQRIYHLLYEMPKKDRVVLGDKIFNSCVDSLSYFREAFKNMEQREELKKKFVHEFGKMKELVRLSVNLKLIKSKSHVSIFEYIMRIDKEKKKWDNVTKKLSVIQATADSNNVCGTSNNKSRGGVGFIQSNIGSTP